MVFIKRGFPLGHNVQALFFQELLEVLIILVLEVGEHTLTFIFEIGGGGQIHCLCQNIVTTELAISVSSQFEFFADYVKNGQIQRIFFGSGEFV